MAEMHPIDHRVLADLVFRAAACRQQAAYYENMGDPETAARYQRESDRYDQLNKVAVQVWAEADAGRGGV